MLHRVVLLLMTVLSSGLIAGCGGFRGDEKKEAVSDLLNRYTKAQESRQALTEEFRGFREGEEERSSLRAATEEVRAVYVALLEQARALPEDTEELRATKTPFVRALELTVEAFDHQLRAIDTGREEAVAESDRTFLEAASLRCDAFGKAVNFIDPQPRKAEAEVRALDALICDIYQENGLRVFDLIIESGEDLEAGRLSAARAKFATIADIFREEAHRYDALEEPETEKVAACLAGWRASADLYAEAYDLFVESLDTEGEDAQTLWDEANGKIEAGDVAVAEANSCLISRVRVGLVASR